MEAAIAANANRAEQGKPPCPPIVQERIGRYWQETVGVKVNWMTPMQRKLLGHYLIHSCNVSGTCFPGPTYTARMLGCHSRSVYRTMHELAQAGWIRVHERYFDSRYGSKAIDWTQFPDTCSRVIEVVGYDKVWIDPNAGRPRPVERVDAFTQFRATSTLNSNSELRNSDSAAAAPNGATRPDTHSLGVLDMPPTAAAWDGPQKPETTPLSGSAATLVALGVSEKLVRGCEPQRLANIAAAVARNYPNNRTSQVRVASALIRNPEETVPSTRPVNLARTQYHDPTRPPPSKESMTVPPPMTWETYATGGTRAIAPEWWAKLEARRRIRNQTAPSEASGIHRTALPGG